ncbi:YeeE/YedE family protein [Sphingobium cupriresistens]|nr:YeeE/YedE thiosulfate transporter family protein [Sphingobium cupriresistens]
MPLEGFIGGLMIGIAAAIMLLGNGRIAGVSGMFARVLSLSEGGPPWTMALLFTVGLPLGTALVAASQNVAARFPTSLGLIAVAGLIVGIGTRLGAGCTSGHGVCGLSRLSPRSIAATVTFMATGIATVTVMRLTGMTL